MLTRWLAALLLVVARAAAAQEPDVVFASPHQGEAGRLLEAALAAPHRTMRPVNGHLDLPRDSVYDRSLLILGGSVTLASTVHGDVVVVAGELFLHPGAHISGRAIALGGGVYNSALATVRGGAISIESAVYDISPTTRGFIIRDVDLTAEPTGFVSFPLAYGFRVPEYDRVDGLSLPWAPRLGASGGRAWLEPFVTYRSALGTLDPSARAELRLGAHWSIEAEGGRATRTNDRWIETDLINSAAALVRGRDYRNYYRADYGEGRARHTWGQGALEASAFVGARTELARSVNADHAWSLYGRRDTVDGMRRRNPAVARARLSSTLLGVSASWPVGDENSRALSGKLDVQAELPFARQGLAMFTQITVNASLGFRTFGLQRFEFRTHDVFGTGNAPPQRYAYLGGFGTLPTFHVLEFGGDRLALLESRYLVPVPRLTVPLLGVPVVTLRHILGAAGVGSLPRFEQNLGLGLALTPLSAEFLIDPVRRNTTFLLGLSLER